MQQNHYPKPHGQQDADKDRRIRTTPDEAIAPVEKTPEVVNEPEAGTSVEKEPETKTVTGVVTDCLKLNVRSTPTDGPGKDNVVTTIECLTEVAIDMEGSTDRFYKICTASGIEGFCMKQYIAVCPQ